MNRQELKPIIEAALLTAGTPLTADGLLKLFTDDEKPERGEISAVLEEIAADCAGRGYELKQVNSGFRFQVRQELAPWVSRLWDERPTRYSRALLETLALIAYRQPTTRAEIEDIRGVSVSSNIIKTLLEREWVRVVGHRDVPGRPALYGTTRKMLDHFNLKSLDELPPLRELMDLDQVHDRLHNADEYRDVGAQDEEQPAEPEQRPVDREARSEHEAGDYDRAAAAPDDYLPEEEEDIESESDSGRLTVAH